MKDGIKTIDAFGNQRWLNKSNQCHRLNNLPAYVGKNGNRAYWVNDTRHRTNGAAVMHNRGSKEYWINYCCQKNPEQYTLWICNKVEILKNGDTFYK